MIYEGGQLVNANLVDYRIPSFSDMPRGFHTVLVENGDGLGPYGSRGMGEGGIFSVAPAITGALGARHRASRSATCRSRPSGSGARLRDAGEEGGG